MKQGKTLVATCSKVQGKDKKTYYNISIHVDGMVVKVAPKFLNFKQSLLLRHKLARLMGDEKNEK